MSAFWADIEKEAILNGKTLADYMLDSPRGSLGHVASKMLKHSLAHPEICPENCSWVSSLKEIEAEYRAEGTWDKVYAGE